ncbi:hypothetical protein FRB94_013945 [Tulasnella sp. JGI-2019a]|nr:hypothetical protein FRB94_013945 [Tulasnella sp. JGI-2019a]KAG9022168.1 hypothetical protein FRB95_000613 [Tulasnella sp. JGI-2019a]
MSPEDHHLFRESHRSSIQVPNEKKLGNRYPDTVFISRQSLGTVTNQKWSWEDAAVKPLPQEAKLHWHDLSATCEIKTPSDYGRKDTPNMLSVEDIKNPQELTKEFPVPTVRSSTGATSNPTSVTSHLGKRKSWYQVSANSTSSKILKSSSGLQIPSSTVHSGTSHPLGTSPHSPQSDKMRLPEQAAVYALAMFSRRSPQSHFVIGLGLIGKVVHVWWYDREGIIGSTGIDILVNFHHFMALLVALDHLPYHLEGMSTGGPLGEDTKLVLLESPHLEVTLGTPITEPKYCLRGRATTVYNVKTMSGALWEKRSTSDSAVPSASTDPAPKAVVKFQYAQARRHPEHTFIQHAISKLQGIANPDTKDAHCKAITGHLPDILAFVEYPETNTKHIREDLNLQDKGTATNANRVLRLYLARKFEKIWDLGPEKLKEALFGAMHCHLSLWMLGVHHRDISVDNIMYYIGEDGKTHGVLNDLDLACFATDQPLGNERTGTLPFMSLHLMKAIENKNPAVKHLFQFDNESFLWVFAWICHLNNRYQATPDDQAEERRGYFHQWMVPSYLGAFNAKWTFVSSPLNMIPNHAKPVTGFNGLWSELGAGWCGHVVKLASHDPVEDEHVNSAESRPDLARFLPFYLKVPPAFPGMDWTDRVIVTDLSRRNLS